MKRLIAVVATVCMMISVGTTTAFAEKDTGFPFTQRTVRVSISPFAHFSEVADDGSYSGIIIDYINEIKKYTGWNVEYVCTDPDTAVNLLDEGKVDLMGQMNKNPQTIERYNFAELNSGYAYSTITTKKTYTEYIPNDYDTFRKIKVGVYIRASSRVEAFDQFCKANGLDIIPVYFDDPVKWEEAFATGKVEAQLTSSAKLRDDEKIIASFKKEPYYFGVFKGNTEVLRELNHALEQINQINPNFDGDLYRKYFGESGYGEFSLTSEEKNFVQAHPTLRVAATPDWRPISYFDERGNFSGISADIMEIIGQKTGFNLEYVLTKGFQESLSLLKTNQVDMMVGMMPGGIKSEDADLAFSVPYLPLQAVLLQRNNRHFQTTENSVAATVCGFQYDVLSNAKREYYDTADEAIDAVRRGNADFTVLSTLVAEQYIIKNGKSGMILVPMSSVNAKLSIAFNNPANPTLLTIFDRAIYSIDNTQRQSIIFQNTSIQNRVTLKSVIYTYPIQTIIVIVAICLLVLLPIFFVMNMRLRLSRKSALVSDTYRIIGELSDEYMISYDFETKKLSLPERFAKLAGLHPIISREDFKGAACPLMDAFDAVNKESNFSVEFTCSMADGSKERFRAICMISYDSGGKPVSGIGKIVSIQAEIDKKEQLEKMVYTDVLTGLYSKNYCEQWAKEELKNGIIKNRRALILIDIDNFKDANDTLGHLGGDAVLKHFAEMMKIIFTDGEVLGRWGGDEFIVLMNDATNETRVEEKARELCRIANHQFHYDHAIFDLSISVGIAFTDGTEKFQNVFQKADEALYQVKRDNKNGYKFA